MILAVAVLLECTRTIEKLHDTYVVQGCDFYGYVRQADLIRSDPASTWFETSLKEDNYRTLIEIGRKSPYEVSSWYQAIAPHCHHYREKTDKIILQYTPGTGMWLSIFPTKYTILYIILHG